MDFRTFTFTGPSGFTYEIREQNGADEDILSSVSDIKTLMNLTKFISSIVVKTNATHSGRLTIEDSLNLPVNDRYAILFNSRIFSLGDEVEFEYDWGERGGKVNYGQDLNEYLFDYSQAPTEAILKEKPDAIPYYPEGPFESLEEIKGHIIHLSSGKRVSFDYLDGRGEQRLVTMPLEKQTKNAPILCRNLRLDVDGNWEKVENFSLFTARDMAELRKEINAIDPLFKGESHITNPTTGEETVYPIIWAPNFFYLTEE